MSLIPLPLISPTSSAPIAEPSRRWARGRRFDLAIGHGSNDISVAAKLLRIPAAEITGVGLNRWRPAPAVAATATPSLTDFAFLSAFRALAVSLTVTAALPPASDFVHARQAASPTTGGR